MELRVPLSQTWSHSLVGSGALLCGQREWLRVAEELARVVEESGKGRMVGKN